MNEKYITQVLEETEGTVMKKLSQDFSRTEIEIPGALSKPDEFLLNLHFRLQSGTVPATSLNMNVENQEPTESRTQNDYRPEVDAPIYRSNWSHEFRPRGDILQRRNYRLFLTRDYPSLYTILLITWMDGLKRLCWYLQSTNQLISTRHSSIITESVQFL